MDNLEYIASYFEGNQSAENKKLFEQRIVGDTKFAEDVALYLAARQVAAAEMEKERDRFRKIYQQHQPSGPAQGSPKAIVRKMWPRIAAAAVVAGIILGLFIWFKPASPAALADQYITKNFQTLPVKMSGSEDSLQSALRLNNEGKLKEASAYLGILARGDSVSAEVIKYAGIVSLRNEEFDKAIDFFLRLDNYHLYVNPGKFYHALTLLKRNRAGDKQEAKILLEQVVQNDLEGKETAREWLKKW